SAVDWVTQAVRVRHVVARHRTSDQAAVVAPVKAHPGTEPAGQLILQVGCLIEPLVVVDAEWISALPHCGPGTGDLWREEPRCDRRHVQERCKMVEIRNVRTLGTSRTLR